MTGDTSGRMRVPVELRAVDQWLPWRWEGRGKKRTKVPLDLRDPGRRGSATDPRTWGSFEAVEAVVAAGSADGPGLAVTAADHLAGVDIDGCRDPKTGVLSEFAAEAVATLVSYAEVTPSQTGIRIWVSAPGALFDRQRYPRLGVELYTEKRFLTVTGDMIGSVDAVAQRGEALVAWWLEVGERADDLGLLEKARSAKNGEKFIALYDRGEHDYASASEADMALCGILAFWSGCDPRVVERLARRSALAREKWDRDDYLPATVAKACEKSVAPARVPGGGGAEGSAATILVELAGAGHEFVASEEGDTYAVPLAGPRIAKPLRGGASGFRQALAAAYFAASGKAANSSALADAVGVLEGRAQSADRERVHIRLAADGSGGVVIDFGGIDGRSAVITAEGWEIVQSRGPLFRRTALTSAMPEPVRGGSLAPMRQLLNVRDEAWDLLVGYMLACWIPDIPHPILWITGEQGTGKTSAMRAIASVVDPSPVGTRTPPRDIGEWVVTLSGSWAVPVDNISRIPEWLSDAMCRAATGDGLARRQLYADSNIVVNKLRNCVMLTGIGIGDLRGDLGDRLLPVELERISAAHRRRERELWQTWEDQRPAVFGALLDLLVATIAELPNVKLAEHPRMADFAELLAAVDSVRGTTALRTYLRSRDSISEQVVEGDIVALAVARLARNTAAQATIDGVAEWTGTAGELLEELADSLAGHPPREWPSNAQQLSVALRRAAPGLAAVGIEVREPTSNKRKIWRIWAADDTRMEDA